MEVVSHNTLLFGKVKTTILENFYVDSINSFTKVVSIMSLAQGAESILSYYNDTVVILDDPLIVITSIQNQNE